MTELNKQFLNIKEAATIVGVSTRTIIRAIEDQNLPAVRPTGIRAVRIEKTALYAWIAGDGPKK